MSIKLTDSVKKLLKETADHDFKPKTTVTPYGVFIPELDELFLYFTESKITSDFIVDVLADFWNLERQRFPQRKTLVLNQDNGPENHSHRTQFMKRIVEFAHEFEEEVRSQESGVKIRNRSEDSDL